MKKIIVLSVLTLFSIMLYSFISNELMIYVGSQLGVDQLNGGNAEYILYSAYKKYYRFSIVLPLLFATWTLTTIYKKTGGTKNMKKVLSKFKVILVLALLSLSLTGCIRPYMTPIIENIAPNESAVLIQLIGDNSNQEQAKSEEFYRQNLVFAKEIEIGQRSVKVGRGYWNIEWRPTEQLIKVSRTPISREWVNGTDGSTTINQGFDVESKDSIGFAFGIVATAQVQERDVAKFLYEYSGRQMESIMDEEIRNHIQAILSDVATEYNLDNIDEMKKEAIDEVRNQVIPYFASKGVTITNIGFKGGLWYEDKEIQNAFNNVIKAQKDEEAQLSVNRRLETEADTLNNIKLVNAETDAEQVRIKESVWETYSMMRELEIRELYVQAILVHGLPTTLVDSNGGLILDINGG